MDERDLRDGIAKVKRGRLSRRTMIQRMVAAGLTAPFASQLLALNGVAMAATPDTYKPTKAGGGGILKLLWWQGPTLLNPHFANGTKDQDGSRMFYEPLAAWNANGDLKLVLGAEVPSLENGGLAKDGKAVTWKLKQGVTWHDGKPFTADDCVFTWQYAKDPATSALTIGTYKDIEVEKVDDHTIKITFPKAIPFWADAFVAAYGCILPKHLFEAYIGGKSRDAPANLSPVGTGPYLFKEFRPGDLLVGTLNPHYHKPNRPYFDGFQMKGGGDAVSAARAVLQTGEYDYGWNIQVEDEVLTRLEKAGKGRVLVAEGGTIEHIQLNNTDPNKTVDDQRSSLKTKHPSLTDPSVRKAMSMLIDKDSVHKYIYGRTGAATANFVYNPPRYNSKNTSYTFDIPAAIASLEKGGWKLNGDGVREKDGVQLKYVFQTSINQPRQKTQQIIKQACKKAGIEIEIKSVVASVFFSSDAANPDTYPHFYTDLQEYATSMGRPDPGLFMQQFYSTEAAQKENKWQGRNITRWQSKDYDKVWDEQQVEIDPVKRAALLIKTNDMVIDDVVVIPVVTRPIVATAANSLVVEMSGFENDTWDIADWYKTTTA